LQDQLIILVEQNQREAVNSEIATTVKMEQAQSCEKSDINNSMQKNLSSDCGFRARRRSIFARARSKFKHGTPAELLTSYN
jgi:hypothetical protein